MVDLELSVIPSGLGGSFVDLLSWSWGVLPVGNVGYRLGSGVCDSAFGTATAVSGGTCVPRGLVK